MRICKTPALGGRVIICNHCASRHYVYLSCGHSHCPLCQSIKREQWVDKLKSELFNVPYVHMIFTLPHELNGIIRRNKSQLYNLLMRTAWLTVKTLSGDTSNLGALPGMVSVLHTFGSDMKYHVHCHCLVTFGGVDTNGHWHYPKRKTKLARYRVINKIYKDLFIKGLNALFTKGQINYHISYADLESMISHKKWVVHNTRPTIDTSILENYLARYINRVAISQSRVSYLQEHNKVRLLYNDYKNQQKGEAAPKAYKTLDPLTFIHQFLQHLLPPYFQKTRRYGIHANATKKKYENQLNDYVKRNGKTIRTVIQIITQLIKDKPYECQQCGSSKYTIEVISANRHWIYSHIAHINIRPPPRHKHIK